MTVYEGEAYVSMLQALDRLGIAPKGSAQFINTTDESNLTRLQALHSNTAPRYRVGYRNHITQLGCPSGHGFYVSWKVYLFFNDNNMLTYETITDGDFPELSARQALALKWAIRFGNTLPVGFSHATTSECERLLFDLYTWTRLPR